MPQPQETVVGESRGGQESQDEGVPGLHALRHPRHAEPRQRPHSPLSAVLCASVSWVSVSVADLAESSETPGGRK